MTTIAAFSDVHGNTPALRAVLAAIDDRRPDVVVDLGDVASGGVDPRGTLDLLRSRPDIVTVRGNHERQLLTLPAEAMGASDRLAHGHLTPDDRSWLAGLPERLEILPGVLAFHGAPDDDLCYLLETVGDGLREASDDEVLTRLGADAGRFAVFLCGHTHLQRTRTLPGGALVVNPGSVGWPAFAGDEPAPHVVEAGTPHARFTLLTDADGRWEVEEHAIDYDVEEAARLAEANDRPDVAVALRTGRLG
ncbi:metallophosphoesterase family protein [Nocardioides sp. CER19]|uniref:metallophosphoesterase family protein n=1 Tax=Nocardioides sp. CER19 TaxID=3038538 RepID=UPI00244B80DA|nr:metallophosphoesterase family protein [Nocardioides sp. CER19]MDH2413190.1 metallophosphoesterase family protein [Nocardioides sp. CER19]